MKDGKDIEHDCCGGRGMHGKGHLIFLIGTIAFVYGVVNYLRMSYSWPPYAGWITLGVVLIIIGWIKKSRTQ